jgi:flagellar hook assembly protein FlgD
MTDIYSGGSESTVSVRELKEEMALRNNLAETFKGHYPVIRFSLPEKRKVSIRIYTLSGKQVFEHVIEEAGKGFHEYTWDCRNSSRSKVASGMYIMKVTLGQKEYRKKIMVIR